MQERNLEYTREIARGNLSSGEELLDEIMACLRAGLGILRQSDD